MMVSSGCTLTVGQSVIRTTPPVTTAADKNGTALERSGSTAQLLAAIGPGATAQRLAVESSTATPAWRSIVTVMSMCGADGTEAPVCSTSRPESNAAPHSSRPETNCEEAEASMRTGPPATAPRPRTQNGKPSPSIATPSARSASNSGAMGRARACSSPSKSTPALLSAASGGTNRNTVPARPQSIRVSAGGFSDPLTVSSGPSPVMSIPSSRSAPIIRSVSRLRSAPLIVDGP